MAPPLRPGDVVSVLEPSPLDEAHDRWYVDNVTSTAGGRMLRPLAELRAKLLRARDDERLFLSGHIGSGKSTELARLLRDPAIEQKFFVVKLSLSGAETSTLTSHQLLFIVATAIYEQGKQGLRHV